MTHNQLQSFLKPETIAKMAQYNYDPQRDTSMSQEGEFAPVSQPITDYLVLPESVKVEWIGTEADVPKLEALLAEPLIGVDSEWRLELTQYHRTRPSLLQVSGKRTAFLIDLLFVITTQEAIKQAILQFLFLLFECALDLLPEYSFDVRPDARRTQRSRYLDRHDSLREIGQFRFADA